MLSKFEFGSYLSYTPRPASDEELTAKKWMTRIKSDAALIVGPDTISTADYLARRLASEISQTALGAILNKKSILVPLPGSGLQKSGSLWVPDRMARALVRANLGASVSRCIRRATAVQKSAFAKQGERPNPKTHYDSFEVAEADIYENGLIVLVDDVITKGATMIAAASKISEMFPNAIVRGFAMLRTVGYYAPFNKLFDPMTGSITLDLFGEPTRHP